MSNYILLWAARFETERSHHFEIAE